MSETTLRRLPVYAFLGIVGVTAVLFVLAGVFLHDFDRAWNILIGIRTPFQCGYPGITLPLSAMGYLLVPAAVALVVSDAVTRTIRRHTQPLSDAVADIGGDLTKLDQRAKAAQETANAAAVAAGVGDKVHPVDGGTTGPAGPGTPSGTDRGPGR